MRAQDGAAPGTAGRLSLQHHWGLYRSDDGADNWQDIAQGVPSDFGFPMVVHPTTRTPSTSFQSSRTNSDAHRTDACACTGRATQACVGAALARFAAEGRLRDRSARRDGHRHAGSGQYIFRHPQRTGVRIERRGCASWTRIVGGLPSVVCVKTAQLGDPRAVRMPKVVERGADPVPWANGGWRARKARLVENHDGQLLSHARAPCLYGRT